MKEVRIEMRRNGIYASLLTLASGLSMAQTIAQTRDPRVDELAKETAQLKRTIADQERRIAELEKSVKAMQGITTATPARIPSETPPWRLASNWTLIKRGMSEAQVTEILGPPASVQAVTDVRTLFYQADSRSTTTLGGSVTLTDDRVSASVPPNAKALQGNANAAPPRIPPEAPPWQLASNWALIKRGMPEAQVIDILGPPSSVQAVTDVRILYYQPDSRATTSLSGSITLTDDRVTASSPPRF
jgi:outer membrane protein assembly factor BamE (lipoprotein component of BamABCDE complex)